MVLLTMGSLVTSGDAPAGLAVINFFSSAGATPVAAPESPDVLAAMGAGAIVVGAGDSGGRFPFICGSESSNAASAASVAGAASFSTSSAENGAAGSRGMLDICGAEVKDG